MTSWSILDLLHEGLDEAEIAAALELSRGDLREHMNVIRGGMVKQLIANGKSRHQAALTLGITENQAALYELAAR